MQADNAVLARLLRQKKRLYITYFLKRRGKKTFQDILIFALPCVTLPFAAATMTEGDPKSGKVKVAL